MIQIIKHKRLDCLAYFLPKYYYFITLISMQWKIYNIYFRSRLNLIFSRKSCPTLAIKPIKNVMYNRKALIKKDDRIFSQCDSSRF